MYSEEFKTTGEGKGAVRNFELSADDNGVGAWSRQQGSCPGGMVGETSSREDDSSRLVSVCALDK